MSKPIVRSQIIFGHFPMDKGGTLVLGGGAAISPWRDGEQQGPVPGIPRPCPRIPLMGPARAPLCPRIPQTSVRPPPNNLTFLTSELRQCAQAVFWWLLGMVIACFGAAPARAACAIGVGPRKLSGVAQRARRAWRRTARPLAERGGSPYSSLPGEMGSWFYSLCRIAAARSRVSFSLAKQKRRTLLSSLEW